MRYLATGVITCATLIILMKLTELIGSGYDKDKMSTCIWAFNTIIWCFIAIKSSRS